MSTAIIINEIVKGTILKNNEKETFSYEFTYYTNVENDHDATLADTRIVKTDKNKFYQISTKIIVSEIETHYKTLKERESK